MEPSLGSGPYRVGAGRALHPLPGLRHGGALFCALRLRFQPVDRLCRAVVVRPCGLLRQRRLRHRARRQGGGLPPELGILAGAAAAALLGTVVGWLAIRRQGIYFAMITLALAQMVYFVALQARFTGGEDGIQAVPRGKLLGILDLSDTLTMYYFVLAGFLLTFAVLLRAVDSPFGDIIKAIRENEPRAVSLGYEADHCKLLAFILSAGLSGLAGSLKSLVFQLASLTDVQWTMSGEVVLMTLVGGLGTVLGPVVGAFLLVGMQHYLAQLGSWVTVVQGFIFVFCVLVFRRGIVGVIASYFSARRKPPGISAAAERPAEARTAAAPGAS